MAEWAYFQWPPEVEAEAKRLYLEENLGPSAIAERLKYPGLDYAKVRRKVTLAGWAELRDPEVAKRLKRETAVRARHARPSYALSREAFDEARRLFVDCELTAEEIAAKTGLDAKRIRKQASMARWATQRAPGYRERIAARLHGEARARRAEAARRKAHAKAERLRARAEARQAREVEQARARELAVRREAVEAPFRPPPRASREELLPQGRALREELARLCAGVEVTVCPAGLAAGLSQLEVQFHAAPAWSASIGGGS